MQFNDPVTEAAVIGMAMYAHNSRDVNVSLLDKDDFHEPKNVLLWQVILSLSEEGLKTDSLTVWNRCQRDNIAGWSFAAITEHAQAVFSPSLFTQYAYHLKGLSKQRSMVRLLEYTLRMVKDAPEAFPEHIENMQERMHSLVVTSGHTAVQTQAEASEEVIEKLFDPTPDSTISTSLPELDEIISGFAREEFVVVGGRPGMGKTAFITSILLEITKEHPAVFFSMDMGKHQIWHRMLSQETLLPLRRFKRRKDQASFTMLEEEDLRQARLKLLKRKMHIDDFSYYSINSLRSRIRQMVTIHDTRIVFIDHLAKIVTKAGHSREREMASVVESLKRIAKEFDITVVALSQLSRSVEGRTGDGGHKRASMYDLKESGAIEAEADIVIMPYRPQYYKLKTWEDGSSCIGQIELQVEKNRNGESSVCRSIFIPETATICSHSVAGSWSISDTEDMQETH